ncbi:MULTISPECIES: hypothetical protein [unclassified Crossiella]|uniref:hypothetical protein n=1 Tax=unclassified Crossiella TaxID=2620835 RepID=UPI001FFEFD65|nr:MULTISPECIES: hypothetical protein [unclassified Crossiella]MCK2239361.1 hypothetical protein [Crossiella sp. S99.2]MCK2252056.1 hypothetical protein [Crossiella sp. S99.1]
MITVALNQNAVAALRGPGLRTTALPSEPLHASLHTAVIEPGLARLSGALVFAALAGSGIPAGPDLTGRECLANKLHLSYHLPVSTGVPDDGSEPDVEESDQRLMLRQGILLGFAVCELAANLPEPVPVRSIVSVSRSAGTFRFHQIRDGEQWLTEDLDGYRTERIAAVDLRPAPAP